MTQAATAELAMPDNVSAFLRLTKQLQDLRQLEKKLRFELLHLQPAVGDWLNNVKGLQINLNFSDGDVQQYGTLGKLKFGLDVRKEYLSKSNITGYLTSFFASLCPDKSQEEVDQLAMGAVTHIWQSRKTTRPAPMVIRTFTASKRKVDVLV